MTNFFTQLFSILVFSSAFLLQPRSRAGAISFADEQHNYLSNAREGIGGGLYTLCEFMGCFDDEDPDEPWEANPTTMQLAVVGYPRSGRQSLKAALRVLGYNMWSGWELYEHSHMYEEVYHGDTDVDEFFEELGKGGFNASNKFWSPEEMDWLVRHSEVKVILSLNTDTDHWVKSFAVYAQYYKYMFYPPYIWFKTMQNLKSHYIDQQYAMTMGKPEKLWDNEYMKLAYNQYVEMIKETIPADRLLIYHGREDEWGPLCDFLGVPVPAGMAYPRGNQYVVKLYELRVVMLVGWIWPVLPAMCVFLVIKAWRFLYRNMHWKTKMHLKTKHL